jgi:hypothetical protein
MTRLHKMGSLLASRCWITRSISSAAVSHNWLPSIRAHTPSFHSPIPTYTPTLRHFTRSIPSDTSSLHVRLHFGHHSQTPSFTHSILHTLHPFTRSFLFSFFSLYFTSIYTPIPSTLCTSDASSLLIQLIRSHTLVLHTLRPCNTLHPLTQTSFRNLLSPLQLFYSMFIPSPHQSIHNFHSPFHNILPSHRFCSIPTIPYISSFFSLFTSISLYPPPCRTLRLDRRMHHLIHPLHILFSLHLIQTLFFSI